MKETQYTYHACTECKDLHGHKSGCEIFRLQIEIRDRQFKRELLTAAGRTPCDEDVLDEVTS